MHPLALLRIARTQTAREWTLSQITTHFESLQTYTVAAPDLAKAGILDTTGTTADGSALFVSFLLQNPFVSDPEILDYLLLLATPQEQCLVIADTYLNLQGFSFANFIASATRSHPDKSYVAKWNTLMSKETWFE